MPSPHAIIAKPAIPLFLTPIFHISSVVSAVLAPELRLCIICLCLWSITHLPLLLRPPHLVRIGVPRPFDIAYYRDVLCFQSSSHQPEKQCQPDPPDVLSDQKISVNHFDHFFTPSPSLVLSPPSALTLKPPPLGLLVSTLAYTILRRGRPQQAEFGLDL